MRSLTLSVKDTNGDWLIYEVIEIRVTEPVVIYADTAGVLTITSRQSPAPGGAPEDAPERKPS